MRDDMILCQQKVAEVLAQVNQIVIGKEECVRKVMAAILAGGHILLEDIPGVGKTTLAMAFQRQWHCRIIDCSSRRMSCHPIY